MRRCARSCSKASGPTPPIRPPAAASAPAAATRPTSAREVQPPLRATTDGHLAACHYADTLSLKGALDLRRAGAGQPLMDRTQRIAGLGDVIDRYKVLLIDAYGVIHDGRKVFAPVNDALRRARAAGRTVVVVTNSPQRVAGMVFRLNGVGVEDGNYDHIACSGELTWRDLEAAQRHEHGRSRASTSSCRARASAGSAMSATPWSRRWPRPTSSSPRGCRTARRRRRSRAR